MTARDLFEDFQGLADRIPTGDVTPPDRLRERARRRVRVRRLSAAAGVVLVVAALAVGVLGLWDNAAPPPVVDQPESPPPSETGPVTMLVSPNPFPADGGVLALAVVNRSDTEFSIYGVAGDLERWHNGTWQPYRTFTSALTFWHDLGRLWGPDDLPEMNAIGLSAPAHAAGEMEWIRLPPLDPGWYRFVKTTDRQTATAVLQVTNTGNGPQLIPPEGPVLNMRQAVLPADANEIRYSLSAPESRRGQDIGPLRESLDDVATLERWNGQEWAQTARVDVDRNPDPPRGSAQEMAVTLSDPQPGAYRIVQDSATRGPIVGHFWITELLEAGSRLAVDCHDIDTIAPDEPADEIPSNADSDPFSYDVPGLAQQVDSYGEQHDNQYAGYWLDWSQSTRYADPLFRVAFTDDLDTHLDNLRTVFDDAAPHVTVEHAQHSFAEFDREIREPFADMVESDPRPDPLAGLDSFTISNRAEINRVVVGVPAITTQLRTWLADNFGPDRVCVEQGGFDPALTPYRSPAPHDR